MVIFMLSVVTVVLLVLAFTAAVWPFGSLTDARFIFGYVAMALSLGFVGCWNWYFKALYLTVKASQNPSREHDAMQLLGRRATYWLQASKVGDADDELVVVDDPDF